MFPDIRAAKQFDIITCSVDHLIIESVLRKAVKSFFSALFIFLTAYALKTLNSEVSRLIEKFWSFPYCLISYFKEGHRM